MLATLFNSTQSLRHFVGSRFPKFAKVYRAIICTTLMYPNQGQFRVAGRNYESNSQALQDIFARVVYSWVGSKTYLEIGAGDPKSGSNTLVLEKIGWTGISIELDYDLTNKFSKDRKNTIIAGDALAQDYESILQDNFSQTIGYLQVDIDPAHQSLACLMSIPLDIYRFAAITFEHDRYSQGKRVRNAQRQHLLKMGYVLVRGDVTWKPGHPFEDWWVDSYVLSKKQIRAIKRSIFGVWRPRLGPLGMEN
jgi:hypothetical protein